MTDVEDRARQLIVTLTRAEQTVAIAESLTGGLVAAALTRPAGASVVVVGAIVAYDTAVKRDLLSVDATLLAESGPVHPEVARQMADGVRRALTVNGRSPDYGLSTTGVAGPDSQGGQAPGTVYIAVSSHGDTLVQPLTLTGTRDQIRELTVAAVLDLLAEITRKNPALTGRE